MIRLGYTESNLLFLFYLRNYHKIDPGFISILEKEYINWLYSTSGFYDRKVKGKYFDFNANEVLKTDVYNNYMEILLNIIKNFNGKCKLNFSIKIKNTNDKILKDTFLNYLNKSNNSGGIWDINEMFDLIQNKNILIVNNLSNLMKQQYESGNLNKIFPNFPKINSITTYNPGYSFMNNGPDNNILVTSHKISFFLLETIKRNNIDTILISLGPYSTIIMDLILKSVDIPFMVLGGELPSYFGVITKRGKIYMKHYINEFCISVPDQYKPPNYKMIEDGCYW